jgi:hypothetical protein
MRSISKKRAIRSLVLIGALAAAVGAYAYWTANGTGTGTGTTANPGAQAVTVTQTSASSGLYPGGAWTRRTKPQAVWRATTA